MTLETERKFLVPNSAIIAGLGYHLHTVKSTELRLLQRLKDQQAWEVIGDRYHREKDDPSMALRFRSAISATGVLSESSTIKIPTSEPDTRGELTFELGERRGVTRMVYFASDEGKGNVVKGRSMVSTLGADGQSSITARGARLIAAQVYVDLYTFPTIKDSVLKATCVRQVHDPVMLLRLQDFGRDLKVGHHGSKGNAKDYYTFFDALMIVEVEGLPAAVRAFAPGDGWRELTGRKEWSACSIALNGWPTVMVE